MKKEERDWLEKLLDSISHNKSSQQTIDMFKDLKDDMNKGFDGMHTRQDKTNGNVMANTRWRWIMIGGLAVTNAILIPLAFIIINKLI